MRHYVGSVAAQPNTDEVTLLTLVGTAAIRPKIYEVVIGSAVAPVDQAARYTIERTTAMGTLTAVVEEPTDPTDPASGGTMAGAPVTGEPTYAGAPIWQLPLHQRPTYRWLAYDMERALKLAASTTAGAGLATRAVTTAFNVDPMIYWAE